MNSLARRFLPACAAVLAFLSFAVSSATAATQYIRVDNSASSPGVCSIIIESFGLEVAKGDQTAAVQSFTADVSIPAGSLPANSAQLIRDGLRAALPGEYLVVIPGGAPRFVQIFRATGSFTVGIQSSVQTQVFVLDNTSLPALGWPGWVALIAGLLVSALLALGIRRREGPVAVAQPLEKH